MHFADIPGQGDAKRGKPSKVESEACHAKKESAPCVDEDAPEPSSPPCYLREFAEHAVPMPPSSTHPRDPLHGVTLETVVVHLVETHGWAAMVRRIPIRCFEFNPSVKSSLTFLRKTPWARKKVEDWFIEDKAGT